MVEKVGSAVNYVKPGDHVISCAMVFCGYCEDCLAGEYQLCNNRAATRRPKGGRPRLTQGTRKIYQEAELSTFAEKMLVHENALVRSPKRCRWTGRR